MAQTSFGDYVADERDKDATENRDESNGAMSEIMQQDEQINELPEVAVADLWVRQKLMEQVMRATTGRHPNQGRHTREVFEDALKTYTMDGVRQFIKDSKKTRETPVDSLAHQYDTGKGFILAVFSEFTKDGAEPEDARPHLKKKLRGSIGMPDDAVVREGLRRWSEELRRVEDE